MTTRTMSTRGWYADPVGRHEYRYWDGRDWSPMVSDAGVTTADELDAPAAPPSLAPSVEHLPEQRGSDPAVATPSGPLGRQQPPAEAASAAAGPQPPPPPPPPPAGRRRHPGRVIAWVTAVVLAVVGILGIVAAKASDSGSKSTFRTDYAALGSRDAATEANALDAQVAKVKTAYDAYVRAVAAVGTRHEAVTSTFNEVAAPLLPDDLVGIARSQAAVPKVIGAYRASLRRERATARAYYTQLARLAALETR